MEGSDREVIEALEAIVIAGVAMTNAALSRAGAGHELTFPQWRVLVVLSDPGGLPVAAVSRLISVTLPATGRQLRRLELRGLVVLEPDRHDRRVTRVRLTEAGFAVRRSIIEERREAIRQAVRSVDAGDALDALQRIARALQVATTPQVTDGRRATALPRSSPSRP